MDEDLHVSLGRFERDDRHVDRLQGIGSLWDVGKCAIHAESVIVGDVPLSSPKPRW